VLTTFLSTYNVNSPGWSPHPSQATASVIGVSETNIYFISVNRFSIFKIDPNTETGYSNIWDSPDIPLMEDSLSTNPPLIRAGSLIIGGVYIYCIFSEGNSLSIQRYDDASKNWVIMTNPINIPFDNTKFIGVSTNLVGLTYSGVPYIRGPNASDTWEDIGGSPIYSYLFGGMGDSSFFLATDASFSQAGQSICYSYVNERNPNLMSLPAVGDSKPPLYVSTAYGGPLASSNVFAVATDNTEPTGTFFASSYMGNVTWIPVTGLPSTSASFNLIRSGGKASTFGIGYAPQGNSYNYWILTAASTNKAEAEISREGEEE